MLSGDFLEVTANFSPLRENTCQIPSLHNCVVSFFFSWCSWKKGASSASDCRREHFTCHSDPLWCIEEAFWTYFCFVLQVCHQGPRFNKMSTFYSPRKGFLKRNWRLVKAAGCVVMENIVTSILAWHCWGTSHLLLSLLCLPCRRLHGVRDNLFLCYYENTSELASQGFPGVRGPQLE